MALESQTHWSRLLADPNDEAAVQSARAYFYERYEGVVRSSFRRLGLNSDEAQDLSQSFFVMCFEKNWLEKADRSRGRFRDYLRTISHRFAVDWLRSQNRRKRRPAEGLVSLEAAGGESIAGPANALPPDEIFDIEFARALFEAAWARLGEAEASPYRQVLHQYYGRGLKPAQIAEELGLPRERVRTLLKKGKRELTQILQAEVEAIVPPDEVEDELRSMAVLCVDPLHLYLASLEPGQCVFADENYAEGKPVHYSIKMTFEGLEESNCQNFQGLFRVDYWVDFQAEPFESLDTENQATVVLGFQRGSYFSHIALDKEGGDATGNYRLLSIDWLTGSEAETSFDLPKDGQGFEQLLFRLRFDASGYMTEDIPDHWVSLWGHALLAFQIDLSLDLEEDDTASVKGQLCYYWSVWFAGFVQQSLGRQNINYVEQKDDCFSIPSGGIVYGEESIAADLADLVNDLRPATPGGNR